MTDTAESSLFNKHLLPGNDDLELLSYLDGLLERSKTNRIQFEQQWYLNLAFFFGRQYVQWLGGASIASTNFPSRLYEPPVPPWRVRLVINKIRTIVRTELSKVTKEQPRAFVIPASSDDDDLAAARAGEAIYEHLDRTLMLRRVKRRAAFWSTICGTAYVKDWIDPSQNDEDGLPGKIMAEPISPFHIYIGDTQEEDIEKQPFVIHVLAKDPEWVKDTYDKDVAADSSASSSQLEQRFLSAIGINERPNKSYVSVKEAWIKPCAKYPKGMVVAWAGDQILVKSEGWPFAHNEYPFSKLESIPTGRFYAESIVTDLIPLQKEYNRTRSQIIEAKNRMSKPQLLAPRGSIDPNKITTEPGLVIFYTPGFEKPQPLPLQNIPAYVLQEIERLQLDFNDLSSQHEVSKGQTPPGVTAATAISYLQEADDSKMSFAVASIEEASEKIGRHLLSHAQQFWDGQRTVKVVGTDNQWESYQFARTDLNGNTDLRIEAGSATPTSRAAKQAFIMDLGQRGWIPPDRALRYLDMAETGRMYEEMQIDARQAQRENLKMMAGDTTVTVNDWDNHQAHIIEHNNYRKKQAFEDADDSVKQAFNQHVTVHKQLVAQEMGGMISPGQPLPGGNPQRPNGLAPGHNPSMVGPAQTNPALNPGGPGGVQ